MAYQIEPHTADIRLGVTAGSFDELLSESVKALMAVIEGKGGGEIVMREVKLTARDRTSLLVDFLGEILALSHINREVYESVEIVRVNETEVEARLSGHRVESFGGDVKAVTYHEAEVVEENGRWAVTLVLDV